MKITYYLHSMEFFLTPNFFYRRKLQKRLKSIKNIEYIKKRVNYYNKIDSNFTLSQHSTTIKDFQKEKKKTYFFDLLKYLKYFNLDFKFLYLFGDITEIPKEPSFVKSRPIDGDNENSILMKLDKVKILFHC